MQVAEMRPTRCAICDTEGNATELYPASFDLEALNPAVFSARRQPDRVHYRMVRCSTCGLVRADPAADPALLAHLYARSTFNYVDEVANLRRTYGRYLADLARYGGRKGDLLEIGCGTGFFLEEALDQGYRSVRGVEPSADAVASASLRVRGQIVCDVMGSGLFPAGFFDVVCLFQVLDHISDPRSLLEECFGLLKPGGLLLCINHDVSALSASVLREHSPIIDIEHTYLYNPNTAARMFALCGYQVKQVGSVWNSFSLRYLVHLAPLPEAVKGIVLTLLKRSALGRASLSLPLGNLYLVACKPIV